MPGGERDQLADEVAAAVNGDRTALERVIHAVQPQVFQLALRFFGDPRDAEDAAQEALIQIITRLDRFLAAAHSPRGCIGWRPTSSCRSPGHIVNATH